MKFELDVDEQKLFDEWDAKHLAEAHDNEEPYCGAVGGRITFRITPTSIGTMLSAECTVCKHNALRARVLGALFDNTAKASASYSVSLIDMTDW